MFGLKNLISRERAVKKEEGKLTVKLLDFIIISSIVLIFFLCPLFFFGQALSGLGFEKIMLFYFLVLLAVVAWVTKGVLEGELELKRTPLDWPILLLVAIFFIASALSISPRSSLIGTYENLTKGLAAVVVFSLFYYLVSNNINPKRIKIIFWSLIISSSLITFYSLSQLLGFFVLTLPFTRAASFNPLGSLSGLSMFLVSCLPLLVIMAVGIREIHPRLNKVVAIFIKFLLILIILANLAVLALLNGFTFWPAALVGMVVILMFFLAKIIPISSNNLIIPLAVFFLLVIFLVLGNFNIKNLNLPAEVSLSRGVSWDIAKNSLKANPIFGSGPATFYYSFSKFKGIDFNASPLWNVRFNSGSGVIFELLANVGAAGTLAFVVVGLIALSICFLTLLKMTEKEVHPLILALFSSFIIIIIFALLFSLDNSLALWSILVSCLMVSSAVRLYPEKFKSLKLSFRSSPKYALALAAVFLSISAGVIILFTMGLKMYLADIYAKRSLAVEDVNVKITLLKKAVALFPFEDRYYVGLANNYMVLANQEVAGGKDQEKIENSLGQAIEMGKKAVQISSNKAVDNESLALIYENASFYTRGALEWAENLYNRVKELEPDNPTPFLRIALINMARSNAEEDKSEKEYYINEAIKKYDEAINKKSDFSAAYYGKAVAYEKLGNNNEAIEQLKKAVILVRDNVDYRFELGRLYFNRGVSQPNISQGATKELISGEEEEGLSVESDQITGATISRNDDLNIAEQIFYSVYQLNPNHANALYSLALLYQKLGENDKARTAVTALLPIIADDKEAVQAVKQQFPGLY
ncbi:MAG: tetratricopeptide repeat protein [Patescibacteria group bacterium]|nr:tetratricopeptide repeat protein [Patescibacteria group bacterium]